MKPVRVSPNTQVVLKELVNLAAIATFLYLLFAI